MGQKANILTLKQSYINLHLQTQYVTYFFRGHIFILNLKKLLLRKNIFIIKYTLNFIGNILFLNLELFFKTTKIFYYKKKNYKKFNLLLKQKGHSVFNKNLFENLKMLKINILIFNIAIHNKELGTLKNKKMLIFFYKQSKFFLNIIFQRRFTLFFDFLKQIVLLINGFSDSTTFIVLLSQIFKHLHKKKHARFFIFFNLISNLILNINRYQKYKFQSEIKGLKLLVKGRIRGKMRASLKYMQEGKIPSQSFNKKINAVKQHVNTLYGVYGLTL